MKYVWMTEYQASNIAVEDTENSTLIEPCITKKETWFSDNITRKSDKKMATMKMNQVS
jgi:hypothetical protein